MLIAILLLTFCGHHVLGEYDNPLPSFPKKLTPSASFHARSTMRFVGTTISSEEYVDMDNGRSRWDTAGNGITVMSYASDDTDQIRMFRVKSGDIDCSVLGVGNNPNVDDLNFFLVDYDVALKPKTLMGPTAVWRKAMSIASDKSATVYYRNTKVIRGITCDEWSVELNRGGFKGFITLYFQNPNWKKFEKIDITIPVALKIEGTKTMNGVTNAMTIDIDYHLFEPYPESWRQMIPIQGIGCLGVKNPRGFVFPGRQPGGVSSNFHTQLEVLQTYPDKSNLYQFELFVDLDGDVARFDYTAVNKKKYKNIQDLERAIEFKIDADGKCIVQHMNPFTGNFEQAAQFSMQRFAQRIVWYEGDFYYLGAAYERGVLCEIWEQVHIGRENIRKISTEFNGFLTMQLDKLVFTYYFHDQQSGSTPRYVLMAIKLRGYMLRPRGDTFREILNTDFTYFNFHKLYDDETFNDVFGVSECYVDDQLKKYIELYVETSGVADERLSKNVHKLVHDTMFAFANTAKIGVLRIPKVDVDYNSKGFVATVQVVEKMSALLSFQQLTSDGSSRVIMDDKKVVAKDIDDCAQKAMENKKVQVFLYCGTECYISERLPIDRKNIIDQKQCDLFFKNKPLGRTVDPSTEPDLQGVENAIREAIKNKELLIKVSGVVDDSGKNVTSYYTVKDMVVATPPIKQANEGKAFRLSIGQRKIRNTSETTVTGNSDFIDSLAECHQACRDEESISCLSFSVCHDQDTDTIECVMSSEMLTSKTDAKILADTTKESDSCAIYTRDYLQLFDKYSGQLSLLKTDDRSNNSLANTAENCAIKCTYHDEFNCQSFRYCPDTKRCLIQTDNFLESQETTNVDSTITKISREEMCDYYTLKHVQNFYETGTDLVDEKYALMSEVYTTVEACAATCFNEPRCESFGFCPRTADESPKCTLTTASALDPNVDTTSQPLCRNYEKNYENKIRNIGNGGDIATSGLSGSGLFWLLALLFLLGASMGASGYVAWGYFHEPKKGGSDAEANGSASFFGRNEKEPDNNSENSNHIDNPDL
ncbi:hypothetical protein HDE_01729 [Halotydeus destructor]|nr:hypothetical protein HDE_01729 [Halotydeus destructor]